MHAFIDTFGSVWSEGKLANKLVTAMSSSNNPHGGQESTVLSLYTTFMHWGAIVVPTGYTDQSVFAAGGNPYGTTVTAGGEGITDAVAQAIRHQTRRLVEITQKFVG